MGCGSILQQGIAAFFEYDTPRIVHIKSKKVGVINRLIQLIIILYVILFALVWKKGYQEFDNVQSAVTTKVKGVVYINQSEYPDITTSVWDVSEYVVPPQENNAFFVITNLIETPYQTIGVCSEDPGIPKSNCTKDSDCPKGTVLPTGNGVLTGKCNTTVGLCLINAWCPVEDGSRKAPDNPALSGSKDFTVFIKNNIQFPKFKVKRRNLPDNATDDFFKTCLYSSHSIDCPIFRLETIVNGAGVDFKSIAKNGGVIQINIEWNCNLDYKVEDCRPKYHFNRLDSTDYKISSGYNFRYSKYYKENGTEFRSLFKAYGIKFIMSVTGEAGKFNLEPTLINVGSGLALLGLATVLCDIFVLYCLKARNVYKKKKYLEVVGDDAYKTDDDKNPLLKGNNSIQEETTSNTNNFTTYRSLDDD